jgi:hypothetical protein
MSGLFIRRWRRFFAASLGFLSGIAPFPLALLGACAEAVPSAKPR